jgi:hypothetical protein
MKYIIDKEINLNKEDSLNSKCYAETLKNVIENSPEDNSFTVGLFGEWGSGKSSIVETVKSELEDNTDENIKFIVYDSWKYANDSFRRMFLLKIQKSLGFGRTELMNSFYLNESEDVEIKHKISTGKLVSIILILVAGLITVNVIPVDYTNMKLSLSIIISFLGLFATIFFKVFDEFKVNMQKPHLFAPEQFEECFKEMIEKSLKSYSLKEKFIKWVQGENQVTNIDKLIIVIDNIDRCNKELAYELLTDTKSFLGYSGNLIFLIPVDDEALKQHILNSNACNKEAEEFLRKFFNVTIRIKPLKTVELFEFANSINKKHSLDFNPDTIDIISKEYASNPRRIIQFFNNLQTELHNQEINFGEEFIGEHESLICKILILREEWPEYYKLLCKNPHLFNENNSDKETILKSNPDLEIFISNTISISKGYKIEVFEKILSNENVFKEVPDTILESIRNKKSDEIISYIEKDTTQKEIVINYLIEELRKGVTSGRYKILVANTFELMLKLNSKFQLSAYNNHRIENNIQTGLSNFLSRSDNYIELVEYIDNLYSQKINYLSDFLFELINNDYKKDKEERSEFCIDMVLNLTNSLSNGSLLQKIKMPVFAEFEGQSMLFKDYIKLENIKYIKSDNFLELMISKISQLQSGSPELEDLTYYVGNIDILYNYQKEKIFERFNAIHPQFTNQNSQYVFNIIKTVNPLIDKLKNYEKTFTQIESFISKLFANRSVSNRSVNFLTEIINDEEKIKTIIQFLENIFKASSHRITVKGYYSTIANSNETNRELVNSSFLKLKNKHHYQLVTVLDVIVSDNVYNEDTFPLLEHALLYKSNGKHDLPNETVNNKIIDMADIVFSQSEKSERILQFFEKHIENDRIKNSLGNIISGKTKEEILLLTPKLLKLAFDKITQNDELFNYKGDFEILKAIGQSGEKSHLVKLAKVIISKLLQTETYNEAFEIIECSQPFNNTNARNIIGYLEDISKNEDFKDEALKLIEKLKQTKSHAH